MWHVWLRTQQWVISSTLTTFVSSLTDVHVKTKQNNNEKNLSLTEVESNTELLGKFLLFSQSLKRVGKKWDVKMQSFLTLWKWETKCLFPPAFMETSGQRRMSFKTILILIFKKLSNWSSQWFQHFIFYQKCLYNFSIFANIIPCYLIVAILMYNEISSHSAFPKWLVSSAIFFAYL